MAKWIVIRDGEGATAVSLVYHNLVQDRRYALGSISSDWDDNSVLQWIFDNAENLTVGDLIQLSNGKTLQWDGRIFSREGWCRMRQERATA